MIVCADSKDSSLFSPMSVISDLSIRSMVLSRYLFPVIQDRFSILLFFLNLLSLPISLSLLLAKFPRAPFLIVKEHGSEEDMVASAADRMIKGEVLAWFQGKSGIVLNSILLNSTVLINVRCLQKICMALK